METVHLGFSKQFLAYFKNGMGQNINLTHLFFEKPQSKSASIEVEIYEQYVAVYTIFAPQLNCKFPDLGYNG